MTAGLPCVLAGKPLLVDVSKGCCWAKEQMLPVGVEVLPVEVPVAPWVTLPYDWRVLGGFMTNNCPMAVPPVFSNPQAGGRSDPARPLMTVGYHGADASM